MLRYRSRVVDQSCNKASFSAVPGFSRVSGGELPPRCISHPRRNGSGGLEAVVFDWRCAPSARCLPRRTVRNPCGCASSESRMIPRSSTSGPICSNWRPTSPWTMRGRTGATASCSRKGCFPRTSRVRLGKMKRLLDQPQLVAQDRRDRTGRASRRARLGRDVAGPARRTRSRRPARQTPSERCPPGRHPRATGPARSGSPPLFPAGT